MSEVINSPLDLPDDWWKYSNAAKIFAQYYESHLLGLFLAAGFGYRYEWRLFSGFSCIICDHVLWVTAGHVIDRLDEIAQMYGSQITMMQWFDYFALPGAGSFVVHNRHFQRFSALSTGGSGTDVGFGVLTGLDAANVMQNPHGRSFSGFISEDEVNNWQAEVYFLVGYPEESGTLSHEQFDNQKTLWTFQQGLRCIPVERITPPHSESQGFWNDSDAFYGQVFEFLDDPHGSPRSIKGMSGGPIFGIARNSDGQLENRLIGIQSKWLPDSRILRAEPTPRALKFINDTLTGLAGGS